MILNIDSTSSPIINSTFSPIIANEDPTIADEDASSCTQSASSGDEWPENQLGLKLVYQFRNDRVVALDETGEINIMKDLQNTETLPRQSGPCDPS